MSQNSSPEFERYRTVYPKAVEAGLAAAAEVYATDVRERLAQGYTYTNTTYFQADGIHPNATGQALLASIASPIIAAL